MKLQSLQEYTAPRSYVFVVPNQCIRNNPVWNSSINPVGNLVDEIRNWCNDHKFDCRTEFVKVVGNDGKNPNSHYATDYLVGNDQVMLSYVMIFYAAFATCEELSWFSLRWGYIAS